MTLCMGDLAEREADLGRPRFHRRLAEILGQRLAQRVSFNLDGGL
jgi:hypothetical protein